MLHSAVLAYVSEDRREAFENILAERSMAREVVWISNEGAGVVAGFAARGPVIGRPSFRVGRTTFSEGVGEDELLALAHPHGLEMTWV